MTVDLTALDAAAGAPTAEDLAHEVLFALGGVYVLEGLRIPQPTIGSIILLECLQSPYVVGGDKTQGDVDAAVLVLTTGKDAIAGVVEHCIFGRHIRYFANRLTANLSGYNWEAANIVVTQYMSKVMNGFAMLPGKDADDPEPMTFNTDFLAAYVQVCNHCTGYDADRIIWDMPAVFGGFCFVRYARENGTKGIARKLDDAAIFRELERQMKGES